jgi:hypothetical protein
VHYKRLARASFLRSDLVAASPRPGTGAAFHFPPFAVDRHLRTGDNKGRRADFRHEEVIMPKMSERERLADLEARQRKVGDEIIEVRRALRGKYGAIVLDLSVETLTEREFRDLLTQAIRVGGASSIAALTALVAK